MKFLKLITIPLLLAAFIIGACSKEEMDDDPTPPNQTAAFRDSLDAFFQQPRTTDKVVFTNVNLISMTSDQVFTGQDVFVTNGQIESISATGSTSAAGYKLVDASGQYLIPGMADMHTHPAVSSNMIYDLYLFIANGVTTTRVMWGAEGHIRTRDQINSGQLVGPTMYVASAGFDGLNNTWPGAINTTSIQEVKGQIDNFKSGGYDFIKVYSGINAEQYTELIDYAWSKGIPPIGHVPTGVDVSQAFSKQHSISHLGKFRSSTLPDNQLFTGLAESSTTICPTMTVIHRIQGERNTYKDKWYNLVSSAGLLVYDQTESTLLADDSWYFTINQELKKVIESGTPIIAGTDTGIRLVVPGISLKEELGYYVFAGMSNYEALKTATVNPAVFMEDTKSGTIEVGNHADLVLLNSNPLSDIANVGDISGVMKGGQWMPKDQIDRVLSWIKGAYGR